jgi:hypothetical protein
MQAIEPSEAKGRGFDPRQPHHKYQFPISKLCSGVIEALEPLRKSKLSCQF